MTIPANGKMGLVGASSLVVTNMVGTGLFLLPSSLATIGSISIYGWVVSAIGATALGLVFAHMGMVDPKAGGPYAYARDHMGPYAAFQTNTLYWVRQRHRQRRHRGLGHRLPGGVLPGAVQPLAVQCLYGAGDLDLHLAQHARRQHRRPLHHVHHGRGNHPDRGGRPARLALVQSRYLRSGLEPRATPPRRCDHQQRIDRLVGVPRRGERRRLRRRHRESATQRPARHADRPGRLDADLRRLLRGDHGHPAQSSSCALRMRPSPMPPW